MGGIRSKEHFLALERRRNTLIAGDPQTRPGMQTLGAKNEFVRNKNRSTLDTKRPRNGIDINGGLSNRSYVQDSDEDESLNDRHINLSIYGTGSRHSGSNGGITKRQSHNL